MIDRGFARIGGRLVHYRSAGTVSTGAVEGAEGAEGAERTEGAVGTPAPAPTPLLMLHSGPGSSLGLVPLIEQLAATRPVLAPDTPGNGDSEPLPMPQPALADYVAVLALLLDRLGWPQVDVYGQHTGAHIGAELALAFPGRVRCLVLDGIALFDTAIKAQLIAHYAPQVEPDEFGGHLAWAWLFVSELWLHFPYFLRDPAHRLTLAPVPPPVVRQRLVVDLLKALPSYHLAYHAVYAQDTAARLPLLAVPTQVMAVHDDPLARDLDQAAALVPGATRALAQRAERAACIAGFLDR